MNDVSQQPPTFDVASVKHDLFGGNGGATRAGGTFTARNWLSSVMQLGLVAPTHPIYALLVDKNGPRLHPSAPADSSAMTSSNHDIIANRTTMPIFASILQGQLDLQVVEGPDAPAPQIPILSRER